MITISNKQDIIHYLNADDAHTTAELIRAASHVKEIHVGKKVYFRGLIELSNICHKDCYYCGIRCSNDKIRRYFMSDAEVINLAVWAHRHRYASLVIQAGERADKWFIDKIESLLWQIRDATGGEMGITLSLGEQTRDTYRRWYAAGACRYLLRIETSKEQLYKTLHPATHDYDKRLDCLQYLRAEDYQVGTGVLIGFPGQTNEDLADDIIWFKDHDIDMIGMGPYLIHPDTPLARKASTWDKNYQKWLGVKMIALTRIFLKDVNIASTTALQALGADGRRLGLMAGANVLMPVLTSTAYKNDYLLYAGKPGTTQDAADCCQELEKLVKSVGDEVAYGVHGTAPHYTKRRKNAESSTR